jgi:hypothetical protein
MPFPIDAESEQFYDEARSAVGSLIASIMGIFRQLISWATSMFTRIVSYSAEHPEAMIQLVGNFCIWMS